MRYLLACSVAWLGLSSGTSAHAALPAPVRNEAAARPSAKPVQGLGTGLTAFYFTNGTLAGAPALQRLDAAIDFRWGAAAPAPGVPADNFSVRWEGLLAAPATGRYRFVAVTGDEVRLWVNGKKVLDTWDGKKNTDLDPNVSLAAGEKTTIRLEYTDGGGDAGIQLQWVPPGQAAQVIPMGNLYPLGSPTTPDPAGARPAPVAKAVAPKPATPKAAPATAAVKPAAAKPAPTPAAPAKAPVPAKPAPAAVAAKPKTDDKASAKAKTKAAPATPAAPLAPGVYTLTARATGAPLEVPDEGRYASRVLDATSKAKAPQWKIEPAGEGFYRISVQGSNKVLEVLGSSTSNGAPMSLWNYYSGNNQIWRIEEVGDGYYKLLAKHSRKALSVRDSADVAEGGAVEQRRYSGKETQQWKLTAVAPAEAPPVAAAMSLPGVGANKMSVYPNPSNGVVQMSYFLGQEKPLGWVLYNQRGIAVRVSDYRKQPAGPHHQSLDFTDLPAGDYNLNLTVGTETTKLPLMIRRSSAEGSQAQAAN